MIRNQVNTTGKAHGRGGAARALTDEQREWARQEIENTPRGQKTKRLKEIAAAFGVHFNTIYNTPKKSASKTKAATPISSGDGKNSEEYPNVQADDTSHDPPEEVKNDHN